MSTESWNIYGYGVCISKMKKRPTLKRLKALLSLAPGVEADVKAHFKEHGIKRPSYDDYMEYDQTYMLGLATIIKEVILEAEDIDFTACDNYERDQYLVFEPVYPWRITRDKEKSLTEESIDEILHRYLSVLTDEYMDVDYQDVSNCG